VEIISAMTMAVAAGAMFVAAGTAATTEF
jgi:hypothetical protein